MSLYFWAIKKKAKTNNNEKNNKDKKKKTQTVVYMFFPFLCIALMVSRMEGRVSCIVARETECSLLGLPGQDQD